MTGNILTALLAIALLSAGCLGTDGGDSNETLDQDNVEDPGSDAADPPGDQTSDQPAPAEPSEESNTTEASEDMNTTEPEAPHEPQPQPIPIDWEGNLGTVACVPFGPNACLYHGVTERDARTDVDHQGNVTMASLTLSWDASTPVTEELVLSIVEESSCGDGCRSFNTISSASGPSPLQLDASELGSAANATVSIAVNVPRQTPSPVYGYVTTDQPFQVTGSLTELVVAD